ncbi:MAG: hypothetical protein KJ709_02910 [Nanoarchaeota archaeon]|nr:hypothetical protein [Nanoarchaeota archaeon]
MKKEVIDCLAGALKDEKKGKKHKGLLIVSPDQRASERYMIKAKKNLELCDLYKEMGYDYKIPEEWFYTLYYCALAILSKFGIESRSQRCTAAFLRYVKEKSLIEFKDEFIDRITVHSVKEKRSDVDERETARYGSSVTISEVESKYEHMMSVCRRAVSQAEEIVYSKNDFGIPDQLMTSGP